jgi:diguanylate cyclase (GGDEF)-like protein
MRRVLCIDTDPERLRRIGQATLAVGAEPVEAGERKRALRLAGNADAAVAGGPEGLAVLERLAELRPALPRIALLSAASTAELLDVIDRVHPYAVKGDPPDPASLADCLRAAFELHLAQVSVGETTRRRVLPRSRADFGQLVTDPLSGTHGYHYLRLRLDEEIERAARHARPLALLLADLDELRALNDRYGRTAGDLAIRHVGQALALAARAGDRVGRWTGGCFAVVMPETTGGAAYGLAERFRADLAGRRFTVRAAGRAEALRLSVSVGVAAAVKEGVVQAASLLQRADAALARAKLSGRNRAVADA